MANDITISNSTYAGEAAEGYVRAAVLSSNSFAQNFVTTIENVKHKHVIRPISNDGNLIQSFACDFTSGGQYTITERVLEPDEFMVNLEFCKQTFRSAWEAFQTGRGFINDELPAQFEDVILLDTSEEIAAAIEFNLWQGNYDPSGTSATYTSFDGICKVFEDDGALSNKIDLIDASDGSTELTSLTVAEDVTYNMQRVLDALPSRLRNPERYVFMVSPKTRDLYLKDLADSGYQDLYTSNDGTASARFQGYTVAAPNGFPDDTIMFASPSNLFFGTDVAGDFAQAVVIDRTPIDGSDNVRVVYRFTAGTQIGVVDDVFMCYPDAT